jgi:predicted nucleic acid-binding protein
MKTLRPEQIFLSAVTVGELLDTNVVSELRKPKPHGAVVVCTPVFK